MASSANANMTMKLVKVPAKLKVISMRIQPMPELQAQMVAAFRSDAPATHKQGTQNGATGTRQEASHVSGRSAFTYRLKVNIACC